MLSSFTTFVRVIVAARCHQCPRLQPALSCHSSVAACTCWCVRAFSSRKPVHPPPPLLFHTRTHQSHLPFAQTTVKPIQTLLRSAGGAERGAEAEEAGGERGRARRSKRCVCVERGESWGLRVKLPPSAHGAQQRPIGSPLCRVSNASAAPLFHPNPPLLQRIPPSFHLPPSSSDTRAPRTCQRRAPLLGRARQDLCPLGCGDENRRSRSRLSTRLVPGCFFLIICACRVSAQCLSSAWGCARPRSRSRECCAAASAAQSERCARLQRRTGGPEWGVRVRAGVCETTLGWFWGKPALWLCSSRMQQIPCDPRVLEESKTEEGRMKRRQEPDYFLNLFLVSITALFCLRMFPRNLGSEAACWHLRLEPSVFSLS